MMPLNVVAAAGKKFYTYAFTVAAISAGRGFSSSGGDMQPRQLVEDSAANWVLARATSSAGDAWQVSFGDDPFTQYVKVNNWNSIDMEIEGFEGTITSTWGTQNYISGSNPGLWNYLDSQVGNTIGLNILGGS